MCATQYSAATMRRTLDRLSEEQKQQICENHYYNLFINETKQILCDNICTN